MRIRIQPAEVRGAAIVFSAAADDVAQAGAAVAGTELPPLPATIAAGRAGVLADVADRLRGLAAELARVGEELQVRASAAELADATGGGGRVGVRSLARALADTGAIAGGAGGVLHVTATGRRVDVVTRAGTRVVLRPGDLDPHAARTSADDGNRPRPRPSVRGAHGGLTAATVERAVAGPVGGAAGGSPAPPVGHAGAGASAGGHHDLRASCDHGGGSPLASAQPPAAHSLDRQAWACWMASRAAAAGLPPTLPLMAALARSGLRNLPPADGETGFFGIDAGAAFAPAGHGLARTAQPGADWWIEHPGAQLDYALRRLHDVGGGMRAGGLHDPEALARWAAEASGTGPDAAAAFAQAHAGAAALVDRCRTAAAPATDALAAARTQLGVHELSVNAGPSVDRYLASAGVGSGNPWCASFVTWSVEQSGHALPGGGWAAVEHWVGAAHAGQDGLSIVDAAHARPGDVVAFDWGGDGDFGADGHIGFLDSPVGHDGTFSTVEGNAGDAVALMHRSLSNGDVVFIRIGGA